LFALVGVAGGGYAGGVLVWGGVGGGGGFDGAAVGFGGGGLGF